MTWKPRRKRQRGKSLTLRQTQILQFMADGKDSRQTAVKLGISWHTVKNHKCSLYERLGAFDALHAVAIGFRKGIIE